MRAVVAVGGDLVPLITLAEAKEHLHVEHDRHDARIERHADDAVSKILEHINADVISGGDDSAAVTLRSSARSAALILLAYLYDNRDGAGAVPPAISWLIRPHRLSRV